ncbi:oxidoreductase-like domain-containing protein [Amphritea japonica]|uniref:oxidoreductase-like domain-containing protein n=2 Tax=Amphritea japonica TaxID=452627 RepID=UPI0012EAA8B1|nr:oxidoreductase-like domain-containing protein [Amphritea japonica]
MMNREKPTPPANSECCESECSPCVWDTYFEELKTWNAEQAALKESETQKNKTEST